MLLKSKVSRIETGTEEWIQGRLGKFTSSEIHYLMGDTFWTSGCQTYVYRKVGESLTGQLAPSKLTSGLEVEAMTWGKANEAEATLKFGQAMGFDFIVCQPLITEVGSYFGSSPDGLIPTKESADKTAYDVYTLEVKCPITYHAYVSLAVCKTPQDLKRYCKEYYFQVLDQMLSCDSLKGYFVAYHPDFKEGNMNIIEFRKMQPSAIINGKEVKYPITADMKFLQERKEMAVEKFKEVRQQIISLGVR